MSHTRRIKSFRNAIKNNDLTKVRALLKSKRFPIDMNLGDGVTPILLATATKKLRLLKLLLKHQPNLNAKETRGGQTALWYASWLGHSKIVALLLAHGADPNILCRGCTPLAIAAQHGHEATVKLLAATQSTLNVYNDRGATPLLLAIDNKDYGVLLALLAAGVDVNQVSLDNMTSPWFLARARGYSRIMNLLERDARLDRSQVDLGQYWLNKQLSAYLGFYLTNYAHELNAHQERCLYHEFEGGLCRGYARLRQIMNESGRAEELSQWLHLISSWNEKLNPLIKGSETESAFRELLFNILDLHDRRYIPSFQEGFVNPLNKAYQTVFSLSFVFKYHEFEHLVQHLFQQTRTLEFSFLSMPSAVGHVFLITKLNEQDYEFFDSNYSVESIKVASFAKVTQRVQLITAANHTALGISLRVRMAFASQELKQDYAELKRKTLHGLVADRLSQQAIDLVDVHQQSSLFYALVHGDEMCALELLKNKALIEMQTTVVPFLFLAVERGLIEVVKILIPQIINAQSKVSELNPLDSLSYDGVTPLVKAFQRKHLEIAEELIRAKANINQLVDNETLLYHVCILGQVDAVRLLLEHGVEVDASGASVRLLDRLSFLNTAPELLELIRRYSEKSLTCDLVATNPCSFFGRRPDYPQDKTFSLPATPLSLGA